MVLTTESSDQEISLPQYNLSTTRIRLEVLADEHAIQEFSVQKDKTEMGEYVGGGGACHNHFLRTSSHLPPEHLRGPHFHGTI